MYSIQPFVQYPTSVQCPAPVYYLAVILYSSPPPTTLQESQLTCLLEEEREGEVVLSGRELQALHPSLYRQALARQGVRLAREGSHEAPSTVLTEE